MSRDAQPNQALSAESKTRSLSSREAQVVVVTGASAGLGRAIVRAFAREGTHIGLLARGLDGLEAAGREVESLGGRALVISVDARRSCHWSQPPVMGQQES